MKRRDTTELFRGWRVVAAAAALSLAASSAPVLADGGVTFTDVAAGGGAGITYSRMPSPRAQIREDIVTDALTTPIPIPDFFATVRPNSPQKARGAPGVALLDYDGDGDLDIYVPNGPGAANSLYSNQLQESGSLSFVDVAAAAGVTATAQDSSGVCFGDIDNDWDPDLYVLGTGNPNILYENNGDGTFTDITTTSGTGGSGRYAIACSMADFDNDGLLDIVVGNSYDDWDHRITVFVGGPTYAGMEHNYLFLNTGGNIFADMSGPSGIENVSNMDGPGLTGGAFTWAIATADLDLDGDVDILSADNQGAGPADRSEERGWNRWFQNDGGGTFNDVTIDAGLDEVGGYMGLSFADFNCDSNMDFFVSDIGSWVTGAPSRFYFGQGDGSFEDPPLNPALGAAPFGWGNSAFDYDNDGDTDVIFHGSVDLLFVVVADNPGTLLENRSICSGKFRWAPEAITTDHRLRNVQGVATGDLNNDGFVDIVSVSNFDIVPGNNFFSLLFISGATGTAFDAVVSYERVMTSLLSPGNLVAVDPQPEFPDGSLAVEVSSADNGNGWIKVRTLGTVGLISGGSVNRDGIGAVVRARPVFPPKPESMHPIVGGASYASQDSLEAEFGLGDSSRAHVDVLWPGGVRNRLYNVRASSTITFPEIPCSYTDTDSGIFNFLTCMIGSLDELVDGGYVTRLERLRFLASGIRAYNSVAFADPQQAEAATRLTQLMLGIADPAS